ncbi:MAG: hypothetical protein ABI193_04470, partial [Minicystis sp.]
MNHPIQMLIVAASAALLSTGCYAQARATPVAYVETTVSTPVVYVEATEAPIEVEFQAYPQEQYEGHVVYYYHDRWYYRDGARWAYYRVEPQVLYHRRGHV